MVSIGFQNIEGLHNVGGCKLNEIEEGLLHDIEILCEVWGCDCEKSFIDVNYKHTIVNPQKHAGIRKGRKSGGFIVLYKNYLLKNLKILECSNHCVWIEVDKSCIENMHNNLIIAATYINDITSTYYNDDIWEELYSGILKFASDSKSLLLTGDFNGRVGGLDDRYIEHGPLNQRIPNQTPVIDIPIRKNIDKTVNSHGNKIIQICQSLDLIILNGRTIGDPIGNLTFMNARQGTSTIDYAICSGALYKCIENFIVLPLTEISDHSKIVTILKNSVSLQNNPIDNYN